MLLQGWNISQDEKDKSLNEIQSKLPSNWTVHFTNNNNDRLYYCNDETTTCSWIPPYDVWFGTSLPYGWEHGIDAHGKSYYINHTTKTTTYDDPSDWEEENYAGPRIVELIRDEEMGFGFVAGSEKPVVVRYVTEGGPSDGKLLPTDQILSINDENVQDSPREYVIQLIRNAKHSVNLKVSQPPIDNSSRKSAMLSSAKKARLKSNPSRVRFAEGIMVNGSPLYPISTTNAAFSNGNENDILPMANVLKVFLENGQTKSFKYDNTTKVRDVIMSLKNKLAIKSIQHFALVLEQVKTLRRNKLTLLNPHHTIVRIASRPGAHNLRCLFRVAFVPKDACDLAQEDLVSFEYLYMQCCNDVIQERYEPELKNETALRLAALHIHQHALSNNIPYNKVTVKSIEREFGLEKFLPGSLLKNVKRKDIRKILTHLLKLNQTITGTSHKTLTGLQAKLYYLTIISDLPSYGTKCFSTNIPDCNVDTVLLVSPKLGLSQIMGHRNSTPVPITDIENIEGIRVEKLDSVNCYVSLYLPSILQKQIMTFTMENRDAEEFVLVLQGYYQLFQKQSLPLDMQFDIWQDDNAPTYKSYHMVIAAGWSYGINSDLCKERYVDLRTLPSMTYNNELNKKNIDDENGRNDDMDDGCNNNNFKILTDDDGYLLRVNNNREQNNKNDNNNSFIEARNKEVLKRVAEMQELVESSEQYLNKHQRNSTYSNTSSSIESDNTPQTNSNNNNNNVTQLKHSDSLLLLAKTQKEMNDRLLEAMQALDLGDVDLESDTESLTSQANSPTHASCCKTPDNNKTSFGLLSPDNSSESTSSSSLQELWNKAIDQNDILNNVSNNVYFESDLIDLTLIPPPILNNNDDEKINQLQQPPDSFIDPLMEQQQSHDRFLDSVLKDNLQSKDAMNWDLDSFLAQVGVPSPKSTLSNISQLTSEEISSFIIPPPPPPPPPLVIKDLNESPVRKEKAKAEKPQLPPRTDSLNTLKRRPTPILGPLLTNGLDLTETVEKVEKLIEKQKEVITQCDAAQSHGGGANINEGKFQETIEELTKESRDLVTSSKSLVKTTIEPVVVAEDGVDSNIMTDLTTCINQLEHLYLLSSKLALHTSSPLQTRNLINKVLNVIKAFHELIITAHEWPRANIITKHAESLANALATLLRSLRIFSP